MRARLLALALALTAGGSGCARPDCSAATPPVGQAEGPLAPAPGYRAERVISGLAGPTQLQFDARGRLFVLEGGPGVSTAVRVFGPAFEEQGSVPLGSAGGMATGLLVLDGGEELFVAGGGRVDRLRAAGGTWTPEPWISDLPVGDHANNGLILGPDGLLYFTVGSTCDLCDEPDPRSATVMRVDPAAAVPIPEVFARGLRNAYDVVFTATGALLATDNGPECCGDTTGCTRAGVDRLLQVSAGAELGWPAAYRKNLTPDAGLVTALPLHGGATGLTLQTASAQCGGGTTGFVALWGTQHGAVESGRQVLRVALEQGADETWSAASAQPLLGSAGVAHPIDVTVGPDGALYVLDFGGAVIRVTPEPPGSCL